MRRIRRTPCSPSSYSRYATIVAYVASGCSDSSPWFNDDQPVPQTLQSARVPDISHGFIDQSRRLLTDSYLPRIEKAVEGLAAESVWWRANPESNSIGNLILHLDGNVRQWIVSGLGREPDVRERQKEFDAAGVMEGAELLQRLRSTMETADRVLANIDPATLLDPRRIQSYDMTVMSAIYSVVEHFSMHTGQIILLAKTFKGDLAFYDVSHGGPRPTWKGGAAGH